jgi:uncharacterized membrane protein
MMAKDQIRGNIWMLFACFLLVSVIISASGITFVGPFLVTGPLYAGIQMMFLGLTRGERPQIERLFAGFQNFVKFLVLYLVVGLFTFLWSLLFFVPGIIKAISYSFAPYILIENPDMDPMDAIKRSQAMTYGHKMELFVLGLSFIPWLLLVSVTFGLAAIYVEPYVMATYTNAYLRIKQGVAQ